MRSERISLLGCILVLLVFAGCWAGEFVPEPLPEGGIIAADAKLKTISTEFGFTEGPVADKAGNLYFTDQPNDKIMVYTAEGKIETFLTPSGRANGLYFDNEGFLLACADEKGEIWKIDVKAKTHTIIAKEYNGVRFNATNDIWCGPEGKIYFSDPYYQRQWWEHKKPTQDGEHVYCLDAKSGKISRVANDLVKPNGLIGTPDGKTLYVSDIDGGKIYKYQVQADGTLAEKQVFCNIGADGMTIDCCGNIYLANARGVTVFDRDGKQIEKIAIPSGWTANLTFGGPEMKTLYITAQKGLYSLEMNVKGVK